MSHPFRPKTLPPFYFSSKITMPEKGDPELRFDVTNLLMLITEMNAWIGAPENDEKRAALDFCKRGIGREVDRADQYLDALEAKCKQIEDRFEGRPPPNIDAIRKAVFLDPAPDTLKACFDTVEHAFDILRDKPFAEHSEIYLRLEKLRIATRACQKALRDLCTETEIGTRNPDHSHTR